VFRGFRDRQEAGKLLAQRLTAFRGRGDAVVLALPRGGVPVAAEIAGALDLPLNICVVRKLGVPGQEKIAMGAIASGGLRLVNEQVVAALGISPQQIEAVAAREFAELQRRERRYRLGPRGGNVGPHRYPRRRWPGHRRHHASGAGRDPGARHGEGGDCDPGGAARRA
jgi:predicted phosphoribosyltransferase